MGPECCSTCPCCELGCCCCYEGASKGLMLWGERCGCVRLRLLVEMGSGGLLHQASKMVAHNVTRSCSVVAY